jgi:serine/threonine-protein kinase
MAKLKVKNYELLKLLGRGPRSYIYKAQNVKTEEIVAVKIVPRKSSADDKFVAQLTNEYEVGSRLNNPFIIRYYALEKERRFLIPYQYNLIMEYAEGTTLDKLEKWDVFRLLPIFIKVGEGLAYIHDRGFVHSDFKPSNVMITAALEPKIFDLGLACPKGTKRDRIQGTVDFIAPEQAGKGYVDSRTDIYCFGASMYYLFTGKILPSTLALFKKRKGQSIRKQMESLRDLNPDAPPELDALVMACLEPGKEKRPGAMKEVTSRLRSILRKASAKRT